MHSAPRSRRVRLPAASSPPNAGLGEFLRSRLARLDPGQAGVTSAAGRRVPGLRREDLARLAGVSKDYYSRLEQGRSRSAATDLGAPIAE